MISTKLLYSFFETLGRWGNKIANKIAGIFCITFASSVILLGTICFYDVIAPGLSYPIISIPICLLITLNLYMHYYYAITVSPGFLDDPPHDPMNSLLWAQKAGEVEGQQAMTLRGATWSERGLRITPGCGTKCRKCRKFRPERTHHCRKCKTCVLKYDHHCPVRINQCVGLHNERHFVLFLTYLVIASSTMVTLGFQHFVHAFIRSLGVMYQPWHHNFPESWFTPLYMFNAVAFCAVAMLLGSNLYGIVYGETTVEVHYNAEHRKEAEERDQEFVNSYDCGKLKNLQLFFNIGEGGYSILTLFLPFRLNPYTDGFSWARKAGYEKQPGFRQAKQGQTMMTMLYKLFTYLSFHNPLQ